MHLSIARQWCWLGIIKAGRSVNLNNALKSLCFTTVKLGISLKLSYIPTDVNPADSLSRRLSSLDSRLHPDVWEQVQTHFGGSAGHTCDLMALDSNTLFDLLGSPLPHFTPSLSPGSSGVNLFAQNLSLSKTFLERPYVFPPVSLV